MLEKLDKIREDKANEDRGFTLIELLVVVVIIGILIAIAIPLYLNYQKGAKDKSAQSDLRAAVSSLNQCYTDNANFYPKTLTVTANVGTPSAPLCSTDLINVSSGTSLTYTSYLTTDNTTACATEGTCQGFQITATNAGGNGKTYTYKSWVGGSIS
jgi:type IV pilus assembly protein PilA